MIESKNDIGAFIEDAISEEDALGAQDDAMVEGFMDSTRNGSTDSVRLPTTDEG